MPETVISDNVSAGRSWQLWARDVATQGVIPGGNQVAMPFTGIDPPPEAVDSSRIRRGGERVSTRRRIDGKNFEFSALGNLDAKNYGSVFGSVLGDAEPSTFAGLSGTDISITNPDQLASSTTDLSTLPLGVLLLLITPTQRVPVWVLEATASAATVLPLWPLATESAGGSMSLDLTEYRKDGAEHFYQDLEWADDDVGIYIHGQDARWHQLSISADDGEVSLSADGACLVLEEAGATAGTGTVDAWEDVQPFGVEEEWLGMAIESAVGIEVLNESFDFSIGQSAAVRRKKGGQKSGENRAGRGHTLGNLEPDLTCTVLEDPALTGPILSRARANEPDRWATAFCDGPLDTSGSNVLGIFVSRIFFDQRTIQNAGADNDTEDANREFQGDIHKDPVLGFSVSIGTATVP